jgi:hypothetical protein
MDAVLGSGAGAEALAWLPRREVARVALVARAWLPVARADSLWARYYQQRFGEAPWNRVAVFAQFLARSRTPHVADHV